MNSSVVSKYIKSRTSFGTQLVLVVQQKTLHSEVAAEWIQLPSVDTLDVCLAPLSLRLLHFIIVVFIFN